MRSQIDRLESEFKSYQAKNKGSAKPRHRKEPSEKEVSEDEEMEDLRQIEQSLGL